MLLQFHVETARKAIAQACGAFARGRVVVAQQRFFGVASTRGGEGDQSARVTDVVEVQTRVAFLAAQLRVRDRAGEVGVAGFVFGEQNEAREARGFFGRGIAPALGTQFRSVEREFRADDRAEAQRLRRLGEAHRAVEAVAVGEGDGREAEFGRSFRQLLGMRGAFEKAEVGAAVEFGVPGGGHGATMLIERMFDVK